MNIRSTVQPWLTFHIELLVRTSSGVSKGMTKTISSCTFPFPAAVEFALILQLSVIEAWLFPSLNLNIACDGFIRWYLKVVAWNNIGDGTEKLAEICIPLVECHQLFLVTWWIWCGIISSSLDNCCSFSWDRNWRAMEWNAFLNKPK